MRSAATHLSVIVRFVVFAIVLGALIFAVVHWAQNRSKGPEPTNVAQTSSQQKETNHQSSSSNSSDSAKSNNNSNSSQSQSGSTPTTVPKNETEGSTPASPAPTPSTPTTQTNVPSTGLDWYQAVVGAIGITFCTYMFLVYWQSRQAIN